MRLALMKELLVLALVFLLSGCTSGGYPAMSTFPSPTSVQKDCSFNFDPAVQIKADTPREPQHDKIFVLVKLGAHLPYKTALTSRADYGMKEIGIAAQAEVDLDNPDISRKLYIGLGHCRGVPGETCRDPIPQDLVYILQRPGEIDINKKISEDNPAYWWVFNVYYRWDALLEEAQKNGHTTPTIEDLPFWFRQCKEKPLEGSQVGFLTRQGTVSDFRPPSFITKAQILDPRTDSPYWGDVKENYWYDTEWPSDPAVGGSEEIGRLETRLDSETISAKVWYSIDFETLILAPQDGSDKFFQYRPLDKILRPQNPTLQLGTFLPIGAGYVAWWTPSCKPVIYLYPEKPVNLSVNLKPFGVITKSEPFYPWPFGWSDILAFPSGQLIYQGKEYSSLYYEGRIINLRVPTEGWVVKKEGLSNFFEELLPRLGLNQKEVVDFKDYWLERLKKDLYFVTSLPREEVERVEPMEISVEPETIIRVRLFFKVLNEPIKVPQPVFPKVPERKGFTVVDWGGFYKE